MILDAFSNLMAWFLSLQENPATPVMALMGEMVREAHLEPLVPLVFLVLLALQVLLVIVNSQPVPWKLDYKEGRMLKAHEKRSIEQNDMKPP